MAIMDYRTLFGMEGRVAIVSGASSGLGLHMAEVLAMAGATVVLAARRKDLIDVAVSDLRSKDLSAYGVYMDVTQTKSIVTAIDTAEKLGGSHVDVMINNAGILYSEKFLDQEESEIAKVFDTNLKGAFLVAQEAGRRMSKAGAGSIINVASTAGLRAGATMASYGAAKAALMHMTRIAALELAGKGVRVNSLCPGNFESNMQKVFDAKGFTETLLRRTPQRRFGKPEDLDGALLLLASDAGRYMTGSIVTVDGGQALSWM